MRTLLGKVLTKTIILIVTLSLICSYAVSAAVTLDAAVTPQNATLTVHCGAEFAGKNIVVQVFEPTGSLDDLKSNEGNYDVTDAQVINAALCCIYQGKADANGDVSFTVAPTGDKGKYAVRISGEGIYTPVETSFEYISDGDVQYIITNLALNPSVDAVAQLFVKSDNVNVYKPYQILNLDDSEFYEEQYDNFDPDLKDLVHQYMYAGIVANADITAAEFEQLFKDAVLVEYINFAVGDSLLDYIKNKSSILGIDSSSEYTDILLNTERFDSDVKAKFLETVENAPLSLKTVQQVADSIRDALTDSENAVILDKFNNQTGDSLLGYIDSKAAFLGIDSKKEYTAILKNTERFDSAVKAKFLTAAENFAFTDVTRIDEIISEALLTSFMSNVSAPGVVDRFITDYATELSAAGANIAAYTATDKKVDICNALIGGTYATLADFAVKLNASVPAGTVVPIVPQLPSGSTGGVSYSGSGSGGSPSVSIPVGSQDTIANSSGNGNALAFTDIGGVEWAHEAITDMKNKGIIAGRGDGSFAPNDKVTREEFVKMLSVALGLSSVDTVSQFSDMTGDEWFAPYVYAAHASGIVNGIGDAFGVGADITRQEMAVLCHRAIGYKGATLETVRGDMPFTDEIPDYAKEAVAALYGAGLVNGVSDTSFAPAASASRAEAAKMLYEVLKAINK